MLHKHRSDRIAYLNINVENRHYSPNEIIRFKLGKKRQINNNLFKAQNWHEMTVQVNLWAQKQIYRSPSNDHSQRYVHTMMSNSKKKLHIMCIYNDAAAADRIVRLNCNYSFREDQLHALCALQHDRLCADSIPLQFIKQIDRSGEFEGQAHTRLLCFEKFCKTC